MRRSCGKQRRRERWIIYVSERGSRRRDGVVPRHDDLSTTTTECDDRLGFRPSDRRRAPPPCSWACALYVGRRAQARHEQRFGESLRDQLDRSIAQLDDQATIARGTLLVRVLLWGICPMAILLVIHADQRASPSATMAICVVSLIFIVVVVGGEQRLEYRRRCNGMCCRASAGWRRC